MAIEFWFCFTVNFLGDPICPILGEVLVFEFSLLSGLTSITHPITGLGPAREVAHVECDTARACVWKTVGGWSGLLRSSGGVVRSPASLKPLSSQPEMCNHRCSISFNLR